MSEINETSSPTRDTNLPPFSEVLPVYQRPESIAYGAASLLLASSFAANVVEAVSDSLSKLEAVSGVNAGLYSIVMAYNALRAHRDTVAFKNASEEERNSSKTVERRHSVRSMRTFAWGCTTAALAPIGVIEAIGATQADNTAEGVGLLGLTAVTAFAGKKALSAFKKSRSQQKELKQQLVAIRDAENSNSILFVSDEYRQQLSDLASELVTPQRFNKTSQVNG